MGKVIANAASPVRAALPVVSRTNHGTARMESMLPVVDRALAASKVMNGRLTSDAPALFSWFSVTQGRLVVKGTACGAGDR